MLEKIFGWGYKVRKLRKKWDHCREKSLKKKGIMKKRLLEKLDLIENNLRNLEEHRPNRGERARLAKEIEINLSEVKEILKIKEDDYEREAQHEMGNH